MTGSSWLLALGVGALGLSVGSFLNVVAWRVPQGLSLVYPASHCPRCGSPIAARDNIPLLSWLRLGRRCRSCRGPISALYPLVEITGAGLSVLLLRRDGWQPVLAFHLVFAWALIALTVIDLSTWLLPLRITVPLIPLGVLSAHVEPERTVAQALAGAAIGWAFIRLIGWGAQRVLKKEAMGGGDAWLLAAIGAFTGPILLIPVLFLASVQGVAFGLIRLRLSGPPPPPPPLPSDDDGWEPDPHAIPFGPFLALGAIETLFFGGAWLRFLHFDYRLFLLP